jgi:hypothetical protein
LFQRKLRLPKSDISNFCYETKKSLAEYF